MQLHFTSQAQLALNNAKKAAIHCCNSYIGTEHLLLGILQIKEAKLTKLLKKHQISYESLFEEIKLLFGFNKENQALPEYTCTMEEILEDCFTETYRNEKKMIDLDCLTHCLLKAPNNVANELLRRNGVEIDTLISSFTQQSIDIFNHFKELTNLNEKQKKEASCIVQREKELETMIEYLCKKNKANPLLVGEAGVGKSALVEELANRIVHNQVPDPLKNNIIMELSLNSLVAGTKYRGEFEEKIQKLLDTIINYPNIILFIDEIHMMIHAGKAEGSIDVAGVLKPYLARRELRCIGATTLEEYNATIEKDKALKRRFQIIKIEEPPLNDVKAILLAKKSEYEKHHQVSFPQELIEKSLFLANQYLPQYHFPDKALDILDLSCVKAKLASKKEVDEQCLKEAIENLSQIPFSYADKLKNKKMKLEMIFGSALYNQILLRMEKIDAEKKKSPVDVWCILGKNKEDKLKLAKSLSEIYFNYQSELVILDALTLNQNSFLYLKEKIKKAPFQLIYVENFDDLSIQNQHIFDQILHHGKIQWMELELDLSNCLFLLDHRPLTRSLGFIQHQKNENEDYFNFTIEQMNVEKCLER